MKKLRLLVIFLAIVILQSCIMNPVNPEEPSLPVKALLYEDNGIVKKYDVDARATSTIFTPEEGFELGGIALDRKGNFYVSQYAYYSTYSTNDYINKVLIYTVNGEKKVIMENLDFVDYRISHISISPTGNYIFLHPNSYGDLSLIGKNTGNGYVFFDDFNDILLNSNRVDFNSVVWDEKNNLVYFRNDRPYDPYLFEVNLLTGEYNQMESPNISLYVDQATLLYQGILQESFDFEKYLGEDTGIPVQVKFHPEGSGFCYRYNEDRILKYYDLNTGNIVNLLESPQNVYPGTFVENMQFVWNTDVAPRDITYDLNDENLYYNFTTSDISSITSLNSNIYFTINTINYSIPMIQFKWKNNFSPYDITCYIRGNVSNFKFNLMESYLIHYTLFKTFYNDSYKTLSDIRSNFTTMQNAITQYENSVNSRFMVFDRLRTSYVVNDFIPNRTEALDFANVMFALEQQILGFLHRRDKSELVNGVRALFPSLPEGFILARLANLMVDDNNMLADLSGLVEAITYYKSSERKQIVDRAINLLESENIFLR